MGTRAPEARPLGPDAGGQWVRRWLSTSWTQSADAWVCSRLAEHGRQIVGDPVTFRARFWSVVRCYPTAEGLVWFKETNPGHHFEARLTAAMATLAPDQIVVAIAVDADHGWLLTSDHGATLDHADVEDQLTRRTVVGELARLQCTLLGHISAEEHPGVLMLRPTDAGEHVRAAIREWATLPTDHPLHAGPNLQEQAAWAADVLDRRTASISDLVPVDLEINDVYPANICADRSAGGLSLRFFDLAMLSGATRSSHSTDASTPLRNGTRHHYRRKTETCSTRNTSPSGRNIFNATRLLLGDLEATRILVYPHRLLSWLRLVPHADAVGLQTRAETPLKWMATIAQLAV